MTYIARNVPESNEDSTNDVVPASEQATSYGSAKKSFFDQIPPKTACVLGIVASVFTLCAIGFIILLTLFIQRI